MSLSSRSFSCDALLFDLDGVLVDSTVCVEHTWRQWARAHDLNGDAIVAMAHGRRAVETLQQAAPHLSEAQLASELAALVAHEATTTVGVTDMPGATELLGLLPLGTWAIVTSGVRAVAEHRLRHVGLPIPTVMICADEITRGKPHPEGYLGAASRLGVAPAACIVVEDAPAGLAAARAAGMRAIAVGTTHAALALGDATVIAATLSAITVSVRPLGRLGASLQVSVGVSYPPLSAG